ncbi:hypothetical protein SAMN05660690_1664 [Geodermatophilus telluris]|uniref:Uncharacterized protein n=1 Tax=Geodermatophilus telluris TaxID=1190417 RepID=A0A1G6M333_9ACTN|nr:hypothetical protein [Geodermatophilus telluris]SDC49880.1 hypothetical protein SAMN05660690_1664 [Geodermatophilus telluris]
MTERQQQRPPGHGAGAAPPAPPADPDAEAGPTVLGFPPDTAGDGEAADVEPVADGPEVAGVAASPDRLVYVRHPDLLGGALLLLAGLADAAALWLPWERHGLATGLSLVADAVDAAWEGVAELGRTGLWQPAVVAAGGAVLGVLGLLLLRPARGHRVSGVLALAVALAVAAAVVTRLADAGWDTRALGPGTWCAVAVAGLGLLGALKAMLTAPRVTTAPAERLLVS